MNRGTLVWTIVFVAGSAMLAFQALGTTRGVGMQYVVPTEIVGHLDPSTNKVVPRSDASLDNRELELRAVRYSRGAEDDPKAVWSLARTAGVWIAALLTLCVFSYLYRDSVFYKFAEAIIVGVSAGYTIVTSFWEVLVAKVLVSLSPAVARYAFLPDVSPKAVPDYLYIVPVVLGCMVFCRLVPRIAWMGRWPLAFVVGTTAGLKLVLFLNADFVQQIRSTIVPLVVYSLTETETIDFRRSIQNIVLVTSVIASLTYFYFSVEHKGIIGRISRMGVWVLMISFGASFSFTVMGRITLLTMRLQFLFDDWLGIVRM